MTHLLEVSSLHRDVLDLSEIDVTKEMGHFPLRRQRNKHLEALI